MSTKQLPASLTQDRARGLHKVGGFSVYAAAPGFYIVTE